MRRWLAPAAAALLAGLVVASLGRAAPVVGNFPARSLVSSGVSTFNGASGAVTFVPAVSAATPAALAATTAGSLGTGTVAFVAAARTGGGGAAYFLEPVISSTPDSFYVIATLDDPTRQWVISGLAEQGLVGAVSPELDLTATQTVTIFPPVACKYTLTQTPGWVITAKDGTVTTGPTAQLGTDNAISNIVASTVQTISAVALNSNQNMNPVPPAANNLDMSVNGIRLQITSGAVLGTATVFKGRVRALINCAKY